MTTVAVRVQGVSTRFGSQVVHEGLSLEIPRGQITAIIGGSGCGKSVLLREIIGLQRPSEGTISLLGTNVWASSEQDLLALRSRIGVLFQNGALFSALTVGENVAVPLRERGTLHDATVRAIVDLRLLMAGLSPAHAEKLPSELSGGMRKRAALARALALEPDILFLDEPTSGLDPIQARAFDHLIRTLRESMGITVVLVTHDLDTLWGIVDHLVVLGDRRVLARGAVREVADADHPWIREYFSSIARPGGLGVEETLSGT